MRADRIVIEVSRADGVERSDGHLAEPGLSAAELFHAVNADVQTETNNQQRTSFYDSLRSAYRLNLGSNEDELSWQKLIKNRKNWAAP